MADSIQYLWLALYVLSLTALFAYGINSYFLMLYYRLNRRKAMDLHARIRGDFYRDFCIN